MNLKVCWFYHDILDLYGDTGNIAVLKKRCKDRDIDIQIDTIGMNEPCDIKDYDLFFLGGGADAEQRIIYKDLIGRKKEIKEAYDAGTFFFLVCGGYQLFGEYYIDSTDTKIEGLHMADYYTLSGATKDRCIGNCIVDVNLEGMNTRIVGFENHGGQTQGVTQPFGKVVKGFGNNADKAFEGYYDGHILGTYVHGPLFPKNPELADFVLYKSLSKRKQIQAMDELKTLDDTLEQKAKEVLINRYMNN